jgi:hypothetical protein
VHVSDITPSGGSFSLTVQPGYVYSITTTTGQGKGTAAGPAASDLALPYSDNFAGGTLGQQPRYLAQQQGAFEVEPCVGGRSGQCVRQQAPLTPIEWDPNATPYTVGGSLNWNNYTVSIDTLLEQSGAVQLMGRVSWQKYFGPNAIDAYYLQVSNTGAWSIVRNDTSGTLTTLASGTTTALSTNAWHTLTLAFSGSTITASVDGRTIGSATDSTYSAGMIGFGVAGYQTDEFSNLSVTGTSVTTVTGPIVAGDNSAKCVDNNGNSSVNGTHVQMWDCTGGASQNWTVQGDGTLRINGKCMDITGAGTANGTLVELWDCNGGANQVWSARNGTLVNPVSGKCLDDPGFTTTNGTQLEIYTCNGGSNQQWRLP